MHGLTQEEIDVVGRCLRAATNGPYFRDNGASDPWWEFQTLVGVSRAEVEQLASLWPSVDLDRSELRAALSNLLAGYPTGDDAEWLRAVGATRDGLWEIRRKLSARP